MCFIALFLTAAVVGVRFGVRQIRGKSRRLQEVRSISASSALQLADAILRAVPTENPARLRDEQIGRYYSVPWGIIRKSVVYKSTADASADEIAVFYVSAEKDAGAVERAIEDRIAECRSAYSALSVGELEKVRRCLVVSSGCYHILAMCGDPEAASEAIAGFYE